MWVVAEGFIFLPGVVGMGSWSAFIHRLIAQAFKVARLPFGSCSPGSSVVPLSDCGLRA